MKKVAEFEKVSYGQFNRDWLDTFGQTPEDVITRIYENIKLPKRATTGSAGHDFRSTLSFELSPGEEIKIPTGIRCRMEDGWLLTCYIRSSLGFKYCLNLVNQTGIVDGDYFYSDNEGHIFVKLKNNGNKNVSILEGDKIVQGIFVEYGLTYSDNIGCKRNGGFGSTGA